MEYRWVSPPQELEAANQQPSSGRFVLPLDEDGVDKQVVFTSDGQITVFVDDGTFGPAKDERAVRLLVEPVDPSGLSPPGGELEVFGNAYELTASLHPSNDRIGALERPIQVLLAYPSTSTLHADAHTLLYSPDGTSWQPLDTTDSPGQQQAEADMPGLGFLIVAGEPEHHAEDPSVSAIGGTPPMTVALLVAAGIGLLVGLALLIRSRADRSDGDRDRR